MSTLQNKVSQAISVILPIPGFVQTLSQSMPASEEFTDVGKKELIAQWLWRRLEKLGIYDDEESNDILMSNDCPEGDARRHMCENGEPNLPLARFRRVWSILKGGDTTAVPAETHSVESSDVEGLVELVKANKPIGQWTDEDLLKGYNPEVSSAIVEELEKRSKCRPFVVFKDEVAGIIDMEPTLRLLKEARKRETPVHYKVADVLRRVFVAGDFPAQVFHECPLHPGVLLFDGYCDECGHTWEGVSDEARAFCRVIFNEGEEPHEKPSLRQLINTARQGGVEDLKEDYPKVYNAFEDLKAEERLPSLKSRTATEPSAKMKVADPFNPPRRR